MKKLITCFSGMLVVITMIAQQAEQKVLVTLQNGETPMYSESCIPMSFSDGVLKLVTRANGQYYYYENGTRKGPFKDTKTIAVSNCNNTGKTGCTAVRNESNQMDKFIGYGDDGRYIVTYNGRKYNEFAQVAHIAIAENQKIAVLGKNDAEKLLFLTPEGKVIPVEGDPDKVIISPKGTFAIAVVKGTKTRTSADDETMMNNMMLMAAEFQSADFASMSPQEMEAFTKKLQKKYGIEDNSQPQKTDYYLYTSTGIKSGPFTLDGSTYDNPSFNISGGENWYFVDDNKLYINGVLVKTFEYSSPSTCNVWISADGKRWAAFPGYENLIFSDGQTFPAPLNIEVNTESGKQYLTWLTLNKQNQIILYRKAL